MADFACCSPPVPESELFVLVVQQVTVQYLVKGS